MQVDLSVFYQDEDIVVACKPYGVLSEYDEKKPNMPSLLRRATGGSVYPVHRLDRTTQGVMVYAKTQEAAKRLSAMIARGEVEKTYLAVVQGIPKAPSGELTDLLFFDRRKNKSFVVKRERRGVKEARLRYETLDKADYEGMTVSLLRICLLTGRTHQIRVQFASRKHPLAGDRRYGSPIALDNIALCAAELRFRHPFTGEEMTFSAEPEDVIFRAFNTVKQTAES